MSIVTNAFVNRITVGDAMFTSWKDIFQDWKVTPTPPTALAAAEIGVGGVGGVGKRWRQKI